MHLHCPHCHNPFELVDNRAEKEVVCPSCGSSFHLEGDRTTTFRPSAAGRRLGKFELLEQLGVGAFGTVYKARDTELDRTVAIKVPRASNLTTPADEDRFLREARAAAQLKHPSIVAVHDAGTSNGTCFLVSDYIQGATLADRLTAGQLSFRESAELIAQVAEALDYAHRQGVIHRDLKPSNIMLDMEGRPHVLDFGLAKRDAGEITMTLDGEILGTPAYMSPEQAGGGGHDVDAKSDVYSLGVILYELMTGERPFRGNQRMLIVQVLNDEPRPLRRLNDHIPRDLETITLKCLSKDPSRRYPTAADLAADLRRWLRREPITARPLSRPVRLWRWCARNPLAFAVYVLAFSLVLVLGASLVRIDRERDTANLAREDLTKALIRETTERERANEALARETSERERANEALARETIERERALRSADESQQRLALNYLQRGVAILESGKSAMGMSYLLRAYETSAPGDLVRRSTLALMGGWSDSLGIGLLCKANAVAYSWDGKTVLTRDSTGLRTWNVASGDLQGELWPVKGYTGLAISPDGKTLLTGGLDKVAQLWDIATRQPRGEPLRCNNLVFAAAFSPDGKTVVTGGQLWNAETGEPRGKPLTEVFVAAVAFSPDGNIVATGDQEGTTRVWDADTGMSLAEPMRHGDAIYALAFSLDGNSILTGSFDNTSRLWDARTGKALLDPMQHEDDLFAVGFGSQPDTMLTATRNGTVSLWSTRNNVHPTYLARPRLTTRLSQPARSVLAQIRFSPDAQSLAAIGDTMVRLGRPPSDAARVTLSPGDVPSDELRTSVFSPDAQRVLVYGKKTAQVWDAKTGKYVRALFPRDEVRAATLSPRGTRVLTGGEDKTARIWDAETGEPCAGPLRHERSVTAVAFSPDGKLALTGSYDSTARLWDANTGEPRALLKHGSTVYMVTFSLDGKTIATASFDTVRLWETATGNALPVSVHHAQLRAVAISPDGKSILTGGEHQTARLWDAGSGEPRFGPLRHNHDVTAVAFSPDGQTLLTNDEETMQLWDAETGEPRGLPMKTGGRQRAIAFSADGRTVVTCDHESVWRLDVPIAFPDSPEAVRLWVEVQIGETWNASGVLQPLKFDEWLARRSQLKELGGMPIPWGRPAAE